MFLLVFFFFFLASLYRFLIQPYSFSDLCAAVPREPARKGEADSGNPQTAGAPAHVPGGHHLLRDGHARPQVSAGKLSFPRQTATPWLREIGEERSVE